MIARAPFCFHPARLLAPSRSDLPPSISRKVYMIPPKPKNPPPTNLVQERTRVPASGKNATPHRNIFCSGISAIFTTRAGT
jgi:hypothetical protein